MLGARNDTGILNTTNGFCHADTGQNRVGRETLPVAATLGGPAKRASNRAELDGDTLSTMLLAHGKTACVEELAIKSSGSCLARGKDRHKVCVTYTDRRVLHTQALEAETRHGTHVANTLFTLPACLLA